MKNIFFGFDRLLYSVTRSSLTLMDLETKNCAKFLSKLPEESNFVQSEIGIGSSSRVLGMVNTKIH